MPLAVKSVTRGSAAFVCFFAPKLHEDTMAVGLCCSLAPRSRVHGDWAKCEWKHCREPQLRGGRGHATATLTFRSASETAQQPETDLLCSLSLLTILWGHRPTVGCHS